ncbi:MAG: translocation/assembly module TamB domain-containing protein, partial [Methylococcales bacterium]|nr:translocation/assembly module TamB domain-containing protein [Methylococcales bacterium]
QVIATDAQTIQLKTLRLKNHLLALKTQATVDLSDQKIQSTTDITLNKLSKLNALAGIKLAGSSTLKLAVKGAFLKPKIQLNSHFKNLAMNDLSTQTLDVSLKLKPLKTLSEGRFNIALNGAVTGLKQQGKVLPESNLSWEILAKIDEKQRFDLEKFQLDGQWAHIKLAGFFDNARQQGNFDLNLKLDHLKALTKDIKANLQTTANINIHPKIKQIDVDLKADISQLQGLPKPAPQLVGDHIQLTSQIELIPDQQVTIKQLSLNAKAIKIAGETQLNLKNNQLEAQVRINIPKFKYQGIDLNRLEVMTTTQFNLDSKQLVSQLEVKLPQLNYQDIKLNHLTLAAKTELNLTTQQLDSTLKINIPQFKRQDINLKDIGFVLAATGTTDKPSVTLLATLPKITVAKQTLEAIELRLSADDVMENVYGKIALKLQQHGQPLAINTAYLLKQPQLTLSKLSIKAPKTQINGNLSINLSNTHINGTLNARSDLAHLKPWHQQALQGQLSLTTVFKPQQEKQSIQLTTELNQFKLDALTFANLSITAQVNDALKKPVIKANAILNDLKQQESSVEQLKLAVSGVLEQLKIQLSLKGKHQQPFEIALAALLKHTDQQTQVALQSLTGNFMKQKIQLTDASEITIRSKKINVSPLSLFFGKAHLQAQVDYSAEKLAGNVQLGVPLEWVNTLAGTAFKGDFSTNIQLSGNAAAPNIEVAVNLKDLALKEEEYEKIPATQIQLNAHINHETIQANLAIKNPQFKAPLLTQLQLPIQLQLEPFKFEISKQKNLTGKFTAALLLEDLVKSFPLDDQKIAGNFNANFLLSGNYDEPKIKGQLSLTKGEYQNSKTETHLKDMQLQLDGHSKQVTLTHLKIFDPNQGSILGTGTLSFDTDAHFPFKSEIKFNHIQLANSALIKTHLSGGLKIKGDIQQALLSGRLNIDDFKLKLASMSSQKSIPEIDVIEIGKNRPSEKQQQQSKKQEKTQDFRLNLDVNVQIANQCFIKGYGLNSEWEGGLAIKGNAAMPKITGLIKTKKGSLDLLSTRFELSHGRIDFNGAYPPLPSLDIEAVASSDDGDAIIKIKGMADDPKLVLAHDPVKPQSEIISHLLFKTDTKTISPMQALKLAEVVTMLASGGLMNIDTMGSLQSGLGLDRLSIGGDSFNSASVKAGKYITDKIYLEVEQGIKSASSKATIEVDVYPEIKAELEFNQNSDSAVGIKWKRDY